VRPDLEKIAMRTKRDESIALRLYLSMIFSENRYTFFRIML
jgi:hypothetical protein